MQAAVGEGDRLRSLETVVADLASRAAVERMAEVTGEAAMTALDANLVVVALVDHDRHLRPVHAMGIGRGALRHMLPGLMGDSDRSPLVPLPNGSSTRRKDEELVAQPIALGARTLGIIVLGRTSDRPLSKGDRGFLQVLGGLFALALDRRRLADRRRATRRGPRGAIGRVAAQLHAGGLAIDLERHEISIDGRVVRLTPSELRLLLFLAEQPGRPRSRREILRYLSGADHVGHERACDVHISNLRRKIERDPTSPKRLVTLRGVGYALNG